MSARTSNLRTLSRLIKDRSPDDQTQNEHQDRESERVLPSTEKILVCISSSPDSQELVRAANQVAIRLRAKWFAVYVETPRAVRLSDADRNRITQTLMLAEDLGAGTARLSGRKVAEEISVYARQHQVTKIIVGKPTHPRWRDLLFGSIIDEIVRQSGGIDVYAISSEGNASKTAITKREKSPVLWINYVYSLLIVSAASILAAVMHPYLDLANLIMVYLLGNVLVANRYGRGPSIFAAILSVLVFDFLFVPPSLSFKPNSAGYSVTFFVMLLVALTISNLTVRIKAQAEVAQERERRTSRLYEMSRAFARSSSLDDLVNIATTHIDDVFHCQSVVLLPDLNGDLRPQGESKVSPELVHQELLIARWVFDHSEPAGSGTTNKPESTGYYLPLLTSEGKVGVLGVFPIDILNPSQSQPAFIPDQLNLLETISDQTALAIERARLSGEMGKAQLQIEAERMRSSLLSSVSHDIRTPLASIIGATTGLLRHKDKLDIHSYELAQIAHEEAERLNQWVGNLLQMTRLESGRVEINKEWQPLEEVVGTTLLRLDEILVDHPLNTNLSEGLPLVQIDGILIEQVLVNLLTNAVKYTPPGSPIDLSARVENLSIANEKHPADEEYTGSTSYLVVEVADRGPGLPEGEETRIFEKFYRIHQTAAGSIGLGLSICKAIVEAHGGRIWAVNRNGGGAVFSFMLPLEKEPPHVEDEGIGEG